MNSWIYPVDTNAYQVTKTHTRVHGAIRAAMEYLLRGSVNDHTYEVARDATRFNMEWAQGTSELYEVSDKLNEIYLDMWYKT